MSKREFDVTSADPVVFYVGPGVVEGVAADDLSANALARIAWIRGGQEGNPSDATDKAIGALRDELAATGQYRKTKPEPETKSDKGDES